MRRGATKKVSAECELGFTLFFSDKNEKYRRIPSASTPVSKLMATPTCFFCPYIHSPVHKPTGIYTDMTTVLCNRWILAFDIFFVMALIEIGPLFVLFLHFRESYWCFGVNLPCFFFFFYSRVFFFASLESCHYFKPVYKSTRVQAHPTISPPVSPK